MSDPGPAVGDMDPEEFRHDAHKLVDWIADYFKSIDLYPVLAQVNPGDIKAVLPAEAPQRGESFDEILSDVERVLTLPPGAFRPPPTVTSAVVRMRFRPPRVEVGSMDAFERIVRGVFLQRRKTLANALKPVADSFGRSAAELLAVTDLDGRKRPGELTLEEVARLSRAVL